MFSTSSPTYPASVSVVASAMVNGTFNNLANVSASKVCRYPLARSEECCSASSTSASLRVLALFAARANTFVVVIHCNSEDFLWRDPDLSHSHRGSFDFPGRRQRSLLLSTFSSCTSSRMMSLQRSTHSSQMKRMAPRSACEPHVDSYRRKSSTAASAVISFPDRSSAISYLFWASK